MNKDLLEISIPQLQKLYSQRKYTVRQVVQWYLARIEKYNGIYLALERVDAADAMRTASQLDEEAVSGGKNFKIDSTTNDLPPDDGPLIATETGRSSSRDVTAR